MNKMIFNKIAEAIKINEPGWLATVIAADGSTPARIGMKMLVKLYDELHGTVGGGAVEKNVVDRIRSEQPVDPIKWSFDLEGNSTFTQTGMICGGVQEILVEPLFNITNLFIIGGGHCGKALCELAAKCDFCVIVIDDRPEIAVKEKLPFAANVICSPYAAIEKHIKFTANTYIVAMTHGHKHDQLVMEKVLPHEYKYFGVIGSKKKVKAAFEKLLAKGFSREKLQTIFSPIGFAIGSRTPMEVAVSILSQLIAVKNSKSELSFSSNIFLN